MMKTNLFAIGYVSIWVVIWGTIGSLIDFPLLNAGLYNQGSVGQLATFFITGFICFLIGFWAFPKVASSRFVVAALGLDADKPKTSK